MNRWTDKKCEQWLIFPSQTWLNDCGTLTTVTLPPSSIYNRATPHTNVSPTDLINTIRQLGVCKASPRWAVRSFIMFPNDGATTPLFLRLQINHQRDVTWRCHLNDYRMLQPERWSIVSGFIFASTIVCLISFWLQFIITIGHVSQTLVLMSVVAKVTLAFKSS